VECRLPARVFCTDDPPVAVVAGVNFPMLLQSDEICHLTDVHDAAVELLALTVPTLVMAAPVLSVQSDDF
jgi:PTS system mannose-specific IIA component